MPLYEFQCAAGHTHEEIVPIGTASIVCSKCPPLIYGEGHVAQMATRILSPTRTTFEFADTRHRYHRAMQELSKE
jgi:hypothetical protein